MLRTSLSLALALGLASSAHAEEWIVQAHWQTAADLQRIAPLFQHMDVDRKQHTVRLIADDAQLAELDRRDVRYQIDVVESAAMQQFYASVFAEGRSIPGFECYATVEEANARMDELAAQHPQLARVIGIGPSWARTQNPNAGYDMRVLRIGNSATDASIPDKPNMVVFSSIHAREYAPAGINMRFAEWLLGGYGTDAEATWLVDHQNFHLIVHANPDGRKKAETGLSWRKNTNTVDASCGNSSGIDLNRNFPFHWGIVPGEGGSSTSICDQTFRGVASSSEPETSNLVAYVAGVCGNDGVCSGGVLPDLRSGPVHPANVNGDGGDAAPQDYPGLFLDLHSYSQLVIWPWGDTSAPSPNVSGLRPFGKRMAWFNGYDPNQSDTLYPTDGTTDDTMYGLLGAPAYTIELGQSFFEPCSNFNNVVLPANLKAIRYAARGAHAPYALGGGPDVVELSAEPDLVAAGTPVTISARIDDSRFNQQNFTESVQNISAASAYLDGLPWEGASPAASFTASDGTFNSPVEDVTATLATTGLASGKHLVFVQGTDATPQAGTPNAVFVDVAQASEIATLSGTITALADGAPLQASVTVRNPSTGEERSTTSAAADGHYQRSMRAGSVDIHVEAPQGYLDEDLAGISLSGGATTLQDFSLLHSCEVFFDDVEAGTNGWTAQAPWQRSGSVSGNATQVWTTPNYGNNLNASLSRSINLGGYADSTLSFDDRCDTEANWDFGYVEVSTDGGATYTTLYRCDGETSWQSHRIALPASTDGVADMRLRFRLSTDVSQNRSGWAIDNIRIESGGAQCRAEQLSDLIFADGFEQD